MELTPVEQAVALFRQSTTPLILLPSAPSSDALAAGLALLLLAEKQSKTAKIVSPNFILPPGHDFLAKSDAVEQRLTSLRNFVISVDLRQTKLDTLSYDVRDERLHIYLSPKNGFFEGRDVTTSAGPFAHDLIITLDVLGLKDLGGLYSDNTEFFYQVPVLNIDHRPENTRYGHCNLVDVVASSVSEIVFEMLKVLGVDQVDERIATNLLTGIISKTKAFQNQRVTPRSLAIASHLMSAGARREQIIENLYQTKTLSTLKLWGRALGRLQTAKNGRIVWTTVTLHDIEDTKAKQEDAVGVLDELMTEASAAEITCLFVERPQVVDVHIVFQGAIPPDSLSPDIVRRGPNYYSGQTPGTIEAVPPAILSALQR